MKIDAITLRHVNMPFKTAFRTSRWELVSKEAVLVEVSAEGLSGWGECVALTFPDYCYECTETNWLILKEFIVPLVLGVNVECIDDVLNRYAHLSGHRMARAGLEMALWDLMGHRDGVSLSTMLGGVRQDVPVGVSVGVHDSPDALLRTVADYLDDGYRRVKLKIKPGQDIAHVAAVRARYPELALQVDGNSVYRIEDVAHLQALDDFDLLLVEQPLHDDDIAEHAQLQARMKTPVCLDESILCLRHAKLAAELGSCRVINIKPGRVGGITEAKYIHDFCRTQGMPVWMGGMYETGIGRAANLAVASLPGFTLPGDISASAKYFHEDIVVAPFTLNPDSTMTVPSGPGLGVEVDRRVLDRVTLRSERFAAT